MTHEESIQALDAIAKTRDGGDSFRLRIQRRDGPSQPPLIYALFEDAQVAHFATPETWLPRLVGPGAGGIFEMTAYHASNTILSVGGVFRIPIQGDLRPPNIGVVTQPGWTGPKQLSYPKPGDVDQTSFQIPSGGGGDAPNQRRDSLPVAPPPPLPSPPITAIQPPTATSLVAAEESIRAQQRALEQQQQALRDQAMRNEIMGSVKVQTDAVMDALRRSQEQTNTILQQIAQRESKPSFNIEGLITGLAPILVGMMQQSREAAAEAARRQDALFTAILSKPAQPALDPMVQGLLDRTAKMAESAIEAARNRPDASGAMVSQMSEAMASMANVTMQLVHTAAEMGVGSGPAPEPPWVKAVREGAKVVTAMMQTQAQMAMANAKRGTMPPPQAPRLPAAPPPQANGAAPQAAGPSAPTPAGPQQPQQAPIDRIEAAIRKHAPVEKVTLAILNNVNHPSIMQAFMAAEGNIENLFRMRLGAWLDDPANQPYMTALMQEITRVGAERGLVSDEETDETDETDEGEEADEGEEGEEAEAGEDEEEAEEEKPPTVS